ncbi:MAG: RNA polymerase sigma factor [Bacteroidota bacterium]
MNRLQAGQLDASGILYERYKKVLWTYFFNSTRDRNKSEDLVQITFEKVLRYCHNYRGVGSVKAWLFSIARNALTDHWQKGHRQAWQRMEGSVPPKADHSLNAEEQMIAGDRKALLQAAMARLEPEKRELLAQIKLQEKKYKEVAALYQTNETALKVRVFRIMKELRGYMDRIQASSQY